MLTRFLCLALFALHPPYSEAADGAPQTSASNQGHSPRATTGYWINNTRAAFSSSLVIASVSNNSRPSNASLDCWGQWEIYWASSKSLQYQFQTSWTTSTSTHTYTTAHTVFRTTTGTWTNNYGTVTQTEIVYQDPVNGVFPIATSTYVETLTEVGHGMDFVPVSTGPTTAISTPSIKSWMIIANASSASSPVCSLPSLVPQCEQQWKQYIAGGATGTRRPPCTQASVAARDCSMMISAAYAEVPVFGNQALNAWTKNGNTSSWPSSKSYGPSCTLGCQQCAVTGNSVQVYYWPDQATALNQGNLTSMKSNATTISRVVATVGNVTLTSPTLYVSYATLYASNSCSGIGRTIKNTIVPLDIDEKLSSLVYQPLNDDIGFRPGNWVGGSWKYATRLFDFADLVEPIPASVYNQMPACQVQSHAFDLAGIPGNFTCTPHNISYAPLIAFPAHVFALDPAWSECTAWYGGLFDPPKALQGVAAAATPTLPVAIQTTPASARSTIIAGLPSETAGAYQPATTAGENDPAVVGIPTSQAVSTSIETPIKKPSGSFAVDPAATSSENGVDPGIAQPSDSQSGTGSIRQSWPVPAETASSTTTTIGAAEIIMSIIGATSGSGQANSESIAVPQTSLNALSILSAALTATISTSKLPKVILPTTEAEAGVSSTNVAFTTTQRDPESAQTVPDSGRGSNAIVQTMLTLPFTGTNAVNPGTSGIPNDPQETVASAKETERSTTVQSSAMVTEIAGLTVTVIGADGGVELQYETEAVRLTVGGNAAVVGTVPVSLGPAGELVVDSSAPTISRTTTELQIVTLETAVLTATLVAGHPDAVGIDGIVLSVGGPVRTISGQLLVGGTSVNSDEFSDSWFVSFGSHFATFISRPQH
ncbi:hypothetical protein LTR27_004570 [Elasticomyces elasticus]|nr:hypothetical protein LTR27_004570 [Elasticomyces elasticus]